MRQYQDQAQWPDKNQWIKQTRNRKTMPELSMDIYMDEDARKLRLTGSIRDRFLDIDGMKQ